MAGRARATSSAGRAARIDGCERARGEARYTGRRPAAGMLHAAPAAQPARARAREADRPRRRARAPGVRARSGPARSRASTRSPATEGRRSPPWRPTRSRRPRAPSRLIDVEWEELEPLLDADEAVARGSLLDETRRYERGDVERGLAEADAVVEAEYRTQTSSTTRSRRTSACASGAATGSTSTSRRSTSGGVRDELAEALGLPPDKVRVVCEFMGGGFGAKNGVGDYVLLAAELARRTGRPVRCALTRREENLVAGNRNATVQRVTAGARADGTLTALGGDTVRARLGRLAAADGRADAAALRVRERAHGRARREAEPAADGGLPRAGLRRGHVGARVPARQARGAARDRPAGAAEAQLRGRGHDGRPPFSSRT